MNGNAQLGYSGGGTGAIKVNTTGNVTVQTASDGTVALIGNGGYGLPGAVVGVGDALDEDLVHRAPG